MSDIFDQLNPSAINSPMHKYMKKHAVPLIDTLVKYGMSYFYAISLSLMLTVTHIIPDVYKDDSTYAFYMQCQITFVFVILYANFAMCYKVKPYYRNQSNTCSMELPDPSWSFCHECQHHQPPRCHHCPICRHCIVKRDHHCFFVGNCIGLANQGYFCVFCLYASWGLLFCYHVIAQDLSSYYYTVHSLDFYHYLPPVAVFDALIGSISFWTLLLIVLMGMSLMNGLFTLGLFLWQLYLIATGLTAHEVTNPSYVKSKTYYRIFDNFHSVFGRCWMLNLIMPMPWLRVNETFMRLQTKFDV